MCIRDRYSNDVVALSAAATIDQAQIKFRWVMRLATNWMVSRGLTLALSKTEVVVLTKKRIEVLTNRRAGTSRR